MNAVIETEPSFHIAEVASPKYWAAKMPPLPAPEGKGNRLCLTPEIAGLVLSQIAQAVKPKAAFALAGISGHTYDRYLQRSREWDPIQLRSGLAPREPAKSKKEQEVRDYLACYFELEGEAKESVWAAYAGAVMSDLRGGQSKTVVTKTTNRTKQVLLEGKVVDLIDTESTTVETVREHRPKVVSP